MLAQVKFPIVFSQSSKLINAIDFRTNRPSDVVSTLVSIYDSRDLFVKELQVLLAQRLLAVTDGNYEKEVRLSLLINVRDSHCSWHDHGQRRNLEILKIRFGEAPLQVCEVMLKDMTDSKRIDQHVQTQSSVGTQCNPIAAPDVDDIQSVLHPTIISRHFWPQFQTAKILMPGQLREYVTFGTAKVFVVLNHVAVFKNHMRESLQRSNPTRNYAFSLTLGASVSRSNYKIALSARMFHPSKPHLSSFSRSRVRFLSWLACALAHSHLDVWTVSDLIERVGPLERSAALKALLAWVDRGVLREESNGVDVQRFRLLEHAPTGAGAAPVGMATAGSRAALAEDQPAVLTVQQQLAEQMKVYWKVRCRDLWCGIGALLRAHGWWQFIEGMLTNLGGLPLDRIQTMLKFAPGYDRTLDQLGAFMDAARREGLVNVKDGIWRLNR